MVRPALGPWARAARKLVANRAAMAALGLFILIVLACLAAPLYADYIAHTDPFSSSKPPFAAPIVSAKTTSHP